jgi:hypothetical protein
VRQHFIFFIAWIFEPELMILFFIIVNSESGDAEMETTGMYHFEAAGKGYNRLDSYLMEFLR